MKRIILVVGLLTIFGAARPGCAQWYTHPNDPRMYFPAGFNDPRICPDGSGGAFFNITRAVYHGFLGHIDRDGYMTFTGSGEFPHLIRSDSAQYLSPDVTLVPSEPDGTVIALSARWLFDDNGFHRAGYAISKFDTAGLMGFRSVVLPDTHDTIWGDLNTQDNSPDGPLAVSSDGDGGLHLAVSRHPNQGGGQYYNRLQANGGWTHPWPGLSLTESQNSRIVKILSDGFGGVMVFAYWNYSSPRFPGQTTVQRFNALGMPMFATEIALPRPNTSGGGVVRLSPGRVLLLRDSTINGRLQCAAALLDTSGTFPWGDQGRILETDSATRFTGLVRSDSVGGFFCQDFFTQDSCWASFHYDQDANLIGRTTTGLSGQPEWPDGDGGAYLLWWNQSGSTPGWVGAWHWESDFQPTWPDSTVVYLSEQHVGVGTCRWTAAEDHAMLGIIPTDQGVSIFRLNSDGDLGPATFVSEPTRSIASDFRIVSAYPNPFNSVTRIRFELAHEGHASLIAYNISGQTVARLVDEKLAAGFHEVSFDAGAFPSGVYFCRLKSGGATETRKMMVLR